MKRKREEKEVSPNKNSKRALYIGQTDVTNATTLYATFDWDKAVSFKGIFSQLTWKSQRHYNPALLVPEVISGLCITSKQNRIFAPSYFFINSSWDSEINSRLCSLGLYDLYGSS